MLRLLCKMVDKRMVKLLFILILTLRIILFNLQSFHIDMTDWESWSYRLINLGISNFYSGNYFVDYFPGYLYILWIIGKVYHFIFPSLSFASYNFEIIIKFVTTLFDLGTAFYVYKIVHKYSSKLASASALLYLANPAVIFNSSVWGQIDGVFTFFLVYSCYLLTEIKKPLKSSFFYSIAILIKPQSLALFPVMILQNFKSFKRNILAVLFITFITPVILSIPFFINNPIFGLINLSTNSINVYPYSSLFAFNLWGIFGWWQSDNISFFNLTYKTWGIILYAFSTFLIIYPIIKNKLTPQRLYIAYSLSFIVFYLFLTRIHERYLFPFLAFILIASFINKSKILIGFYFLISLIHVFNLWYVYYFYNFVYNNIKSDSNLLFKFITDYHIIFSIVLILSFISITLLYYRLVYEKINK